MSETSLSGFPARFETVTYKGISFISVSGELDRYNAPYFQNLLGEGIGNQTTTSTVVNLNEVTYIEATPVGALLTTAKGHEQAGKPFVVDLTNSVRPGYIVRQLEILHVLEKLCIVTAE